MAKSEKCSGLQEEEEMQDAISITHYHFSIISDVSHLSAAGTATLAEDGKKDSWPQSPKQDDMCKPQ